MDGTVEVEIQIDEAAAAMLGNAHNREVVGHRISRLPHPRSAPPLLARAIAEIKAEARAAGPTDEDINADFAAYNAERRARSGG